MANTKKISELPQASDTDGLMTLGVNNRNESVKVSLGQIISDFSNLKNSVGEANGIAKLDADKLIPDANIPTKYRNIINFYAIISTTNISSGDASKSGRLCYNDASNRFVVIDNEGKAYDYFDGADDFGVAATGGVIPSTDKLYICMTNGNVYRWNGSKLVVIYASALLGTTSTTAFAGSRGKTLEDWKTTHEQAFNEFVDSKGQNNGLAPLNDDLEVGEEYIPNVFRNVVTFSGFVSGVTVEELGASGSGKVVFNKSTGKLVYKVGSLYYGAWEGYEKYGDLTSDGIALSESKIYIDTLTNIAYRYNGVQIESLSSAEINVDTLIKNGLDGKRIAVIGDSISACESATVWHNILSQVYAIAVDSYAVEGANYNTMRQQVAAITDSGKKYNIIFVFGGVEDFRTDTIMGEWYTESQESIRIDGTLTTRNKRTVNTTTGFKGRVNALLNELKSQFPGTQIVLMTPIHMGDTTSIPNDLYANARGLYLEDYVIAIREAADIWAVNLIDTYAKSGIIGTVDSYNYYFDSSTNKLVPNRFGQCAIFDCVAYNLINISPNINQ